jgi:hypothetical protein
MDRSVVRSSERHPFGRRERPSGRFTLKKQKTEEKFAEINFPKVSCRTHMYNQLITQLNSISKLSRDISESSDFNQHKDFPADRKFNRQLNSCNVCVCVKIFPIRYDYH